MRTPQPSLFDAPLPQGKPPAKPQAQASTTAPRKGHQEPASTTNTPKAREGHQARKPRTVARGKNYKARRHPNRPPAKKKIVTTRPVRLQELPEGPTGHIVESITANGQRYVMVKWEHRPEPSLHNPMYLIPVTDKE